MAIYDIEQASNVLKQDTPQVSLAERIKATKDIANALNNIVPEDTARKKVTNYNEKAYKSSKSSMHLKVMNTPDSEETLERNTQVLADYYSSNKVLLDATLVNPLSGALSHLMAPQGNAQQLPMKETEAPKKKDRGYLGLGNKVHKVGKEVRKLFRIKTPVKENASEKEGLDPGVKKGLESLITQVDRMTKSDAYTKHDKVKLTSFKGSLDCALEAKQTEDMMQKVNDAFNDHEKELSSIKPGFFNGLKKAWNSAMDVIAGGNYKVEIKQENVKSDMGVKVNGCIDKNDLKMDDKAEDNGSTRFSVDR